MDLPDEAEMTGADAGGALDENAISKRAYELWLERGCPEGSPERDWYQAESELRMRGEGAPTTSSNR
jgi:hypothetical protein